MEFLDGHPSRAAQVRWTSSHTGRTADFRLHRTVWRQPGIYPAGRFPSMFTASMRTYYIIRVKDLHQAASTTPAGYNRPRYKEHREGQTRLSPEERESILQRREAALERLDEGHRILLQSLEGIETRRRSSASDGRSETSCCTWTRSGMWTRWRRSPARRWTCCCLSPAAKSISFGIWNGRRHPSAVPRPADVTDPGAVDACGDAAQPGNAYPALTLLELLERSAGH